MYVFTSDAGEVFSLYDSKATSRYAGTTEGFPTPDQFWASNEPTDLHVGGRQGSDVDQFVKWLRSKLDEYLARTGESPTSREAVSARWRS